MTDLFGENIETIKKDWNGNSQSAYVCNGCSNHSNKDRQEQDYYATPLEATEKLMNVEMFSKEVLEPCVGGGI